jgi:hypothetical protein
VIYCSRERRAQTSLSLTRRSGPSTATEVAHICLALARIEDRFLATNWCHYAIANDGDFPSLDLSPDTVWRAPKAFSQPNGVVARGIAMLGDITRADMLAVGHAASTYDGPGRTAVPTPVENLQRYIAQLKVKDPKKMLLGPSWKKGVQGETPRRNDLFARVAHAFLADAKSYRAAFRESAAVVARGAAPPTKTKVQLLEKIKEMESAGAENDLLIGAMEREGKRAVAALCSANARARKLRVRWFVMQPRLY